MCLQPHKLRYQQSQSPIVERIIKPLFSAKPFRTSSKWLSSHQLVDYYPVCKARCSRSHNRNLCSPSNLNHFSKFNLKPQRLKSKRVFRLQLQRFNKLKFRYSKILSRKSLNINNGKKLVSREQLVTNSHGSCLMVKQRTKFVQIHTCSRMIWKYYFRTFS